MCKRTRRLNFQKFLKIEKDQNHATFSLETALRLAFRRDGQPLGINRTVGQIYALLYAAREPINADEIAEALGFSRSNVSIGLKELESWKLVRLSHKPGDRREYFSAPDDIWTIFRTLAEERRKREIDPTLSLLRDVMLESPTDPDDRHAQARMKEMYQLITLMTNWFDDVQKLDADSLQQLMKMGAKVHKLLEMKNKLAVVVGGKSK